MTPHPGSRTWSPDALLGQVALVTGASSGIGAACAEALADSGATVYALTRHPERVADRRIRGVMADASNTDEIEGATAEIARREGRVDVALANAASVTVAPFLEADYADWRAEFELNVVGSLALFRAATPHMVAGGGGSLIGIGSSAAERGGRAGHVFYGATKAALVGAVKGIARELGGLGIRANVVQPGATEGTDMASIIQKEQSPGQFGTGSFLGRAARPSEIADAVVFLASDASTHITGSVIRVDGGAMYRDSH